jgi:hypothetical protein
MNCFRACFQCSGKNSELLPSDLESDEGIVEDSVSQGLRDLPAVALVSRVEVRFVPRYNLYIISITIWYHERVRELLGVEDVDPILESLVSKTLVQFFLEISYVENYDS